MFDRSGMIRASKNSHQPRRRLRANDAPQLLAFFIALKSYRRFTVRTTRLHLLCFH
jgi:hypothetical protein